MILETRRFRRKVKGKGMHTGIVIQGCYKCGLTTRRFGWRRWRRRLGSVAKWCTDENGDRVLVGYETEQMRANAEDIRALADRGGGLLGMNRSETPLVVNLGGGTNSTGLLVGLHERGVRPDLIIFADTGDEKPETYKHLWTLHEWLATVRFPSVVVLRRKISRGKNKGKVFTLEEECYANETLPSKAFGYKGCSVKWKGQVIDSALKRAYRQHIREGGTIRRMLGFDFGEVHRARFQPEPPWAWEYPLIDWRWTRDDCLAAIERAGMTDPGKSACFYCPSSRKAEVVDLMERHPALYDRAVAMERMARPGLGPDTKIKGLGRHWSWETVGDAHRKKLDIVVDESHCDMPCGADCGT